MSTHNEYTALAKEASLVSPNSRGNRRIVVESPQALSLIGLLGLGLLLLGRLQI